MAARKKTKRVPDRRLDESIFLKLGLSADEKEALRKDLHLIYAAAYSGDGIILTTDDIIQRIWNKCSSQFHLPKRIVWVNPVEVKISSVENA